MITTNKDGTPHAVRVGVTLVDTMHEEERLFYQFEIKKSYGMFLGSARSQAEGAAFGVPADGPLLARVDDRPAQLGDPRECGR